MILERKNFKVFGIDANVDEIGQFGSNASGNKLNTKDIDDIQGLAAWSRGWGAAVIGNKSYPALQERNAVDYAISYQQGYLQQEGIGEWHPATEYRKGSIVKSVIGDEVRIHRSIKDNNIGNPLSDSTSWVDWSLFAQQSLLDELNALKNKVSKMFPDFSNVHTIASSSHSGSKTINLDGVIYGHCYGDNGDNKLFITHPQSSKEETWTVNGQSGNGENRGAFSMQLVKGTKIRWSRSGNGAITIKFAPMMYEPISDNTVYFS